MSTLDTTLASLPGVRLSAGDLLERLDGQGLLRGLVHEALSERLVQEEAGRAGLSVTDEELQAAADAFRRERGLHSAADTQAWLTRQGMSVVGLEKQLEEQLLAAKLKQHLTAPRVEEYFTSRQGEFELLLLVYLVVERDDLARELASQVHDDGRCLEEVAGEHGLSVERRGAPRANLPPSLAEVLAAVKTGELVGPVATPEGFVLAVVEERRPLELDAGARRRLQDELFDRWLADHMKQAKYEPWQA
jgi:hypothetical protein